MTAAQDPERPLGVIEAMGTTRAIRHLENRPVDESLIRKVLWAATRASSPGNSQGWEFVVLRDAQKKRRIGQAIASRRPEDPMIAKPDPTQARMLRGAFHLIDHFHEVPVVIFVCGRLIYPPQKPLKRFVWSTVYPAAQNLIVAARSLGLGTTFTTLHEFAEPEIRRELALPDDVLIGVTIALGYPARAFGPVARRPLDEVVHWDTW